ncbi:MAG: helix-turn-helix transcriptional regulator [Kangiellaceae bacterium]|nr:helix-turn-helix transcriptional regulator [Kangiellaceae bacterium]MCW9017252.1 helix-turn-helix transcriptional regulator [Kangiellaceae bacterium]
MQSLENAKRRIELDSLLYNGESFSELKKRLSQQNNTEDLISSFKERLDEEMEMVYRDNNLKIKDIALRLLMSERNFFRYVNQAYSLRPSDFVRKYRLAKAINLIVSGEPIGSVGIKVGFGSYSYFSRCFREEYGCTASQFVKKIRAAEELTA